jgi:GAF domain-containing protein
LRAHLFNRQTAAEQILPPRLPPMINREGPTGAELAEFAMPPGPEDQQEPAGVPGAVKHLLGHAPIAEHLHALLSLAAARLHGSCALILRIGGQLRVTVSSDAKAEAISQWQSTNLCGPSLDAINDDVPVYVLAGPSGRWPHYARLAAGHGISCTMSIPLPLPADTAAAGALTVYRALPARFTPAQQQLAQQLAAQMAGALALVLHIASRAALLVAGLLEQSAIDTAVGILMARDGDDEEQALSALRAQAAARDVGIAEIAGELIAVTCAE